MSFLENAFLGDEILNFNNENIVGNELYDLSIRINKFINKKLLSIQKDPLYNTDAFIISLMIKSLHSFNSIIILSRFGLQDDSKALLRVLTEGIIHLGAIINDENYFSEYLKKSDKQVLTIVNNLKRKSNRKYITDKVFKEVKNNNFDELRKLVASMDEAYKELWKVAKVADMMSFYVYVYGTLCDYVHVNATVIKEYMNYEGSKFIAFNNLPKSDDLDYVLKTANYLMITMIDRINGNFNLGLDDDISSLSDKVNQLAQRS